MYDAGGRCIPQRSGPAGNSRPVGSHRPGAETRQGAPTLPIVADRLPASVRPPKAGRLRHAARASRRRQAGDNSGGIHVSANQVGRSSGHRGNGRRRHRGFRVGGIRHEGRISDNGRPAARSRPAAGQAHQGENQGRGRGPRVSDQPARQDSAAGRRHTARHPGSLPRTAGLPAGHQPGVPGRRRARPVQESRPCPQVADRSVLPRQVPGAGPRQGDRRRQPLDL